MSKMVFFEKIKNYIFKVAISLLTIFINEFIEWLQKVPELIANMVKGKLIGCKTYVNKETDEYGNMTERSDNYSYDNGKWCVTTATRRVRESDVPADIRNRAYSMDIDVTDELVLEMG